MNEFTVILKEVLQELMCDRNCLVSGLEDYRCSAAGEVDLHVMSDGAGKLYLALAFWGENEYLTVGMNDGEECWDWDERPELLVDAWAVGEKEIELEDLHKAMAAALCNWVLVRLDKDDRNVLVKVEAKNQNGGGIWFRWKGEVPISKLKEVGWWRDPDAR